VTAETLDIVGLAVGVILTLMVFSYLLGDNPFYRLALYIFIGALVGYSLGVVFEGVLSDQIIGQWSEGNRVTLIPLALGLLLLFKFFPKQADSGNISVAYLVGVGTAVALGGAFLGTIGPQVQATSRLGGLDGLFVLVGTICTLMAFTFTAQKQHGLAGQWGRIVRVMGWVGRCFLIVAFGIAFAGALTASLSIFIGRIQYLIRALMDLISAW
jgi:hypothetical protein